MSSRCRGEADGWRQSQRVAHAEGRESQSRRLRSGREGGRQSPSPTILTDICSRYFKNALTTAEFSRAQTIRNLCSACARQIH